MAGDFDAFAVVRDAVAIVCEVRPDSLTRQTSFDELQADSLARVSIADVIEAGVLAQARRSLYIDDASLGRVASLGELTDYVLAGVD
jgi:hypothetical protein